MMIMMSSPSMKKVGNKVLKKDANLAADEDII